MKYWAYINNEILGPFEKEKLLELPAFGSSALICPQTPVGEKTEDWKEASSYPEVAVILQNQPTAQLSPAAMPIAEPAISLSLNDAPKQEESPTIPLPASGPEGPAKAGQAGGGVSAPEPANGSASLNSSFAEPRPFEALAKKDGSSPAPLEPAASPLAGMEIEVTHFGGPKSSGKIEHPVTELARNSGASFDPLSLSQIGQGPRNTQEAAAEAGKTTDGVSAPPLEAAGHEIKISVNSGAPEPLQAPKPMAEYALNVRAPAALNPAETPAGRGPLALSTAETLACRGPLALSTAEIEALSAKIQAIGEKALTGAELNSQLEPFKQKLEQMGATLASMGASQFQRDLFVKLGHLETAVSEMKTALAALAKEKTAHKTVAAAEKKPDPVHGAQTPSKEPKKEDKNPEIVDSGRKNLKFKMFLGKFSKPLLTLILLTAVTLVAIFGLRQLGIFDATKFIPFHIPFLTAPEAEPDTDALAVEESATPGTAAQTAPEKPKPPVSKAKEAAVPPEVIYFLRTYSLRPGGIILENAIRQEAAKAGWDSNKLEWEGKSSMEEGFYSLAAVIPSKNGKNKLAFAYAINMKQKTVKPLDETGKAVMESMIEASALKKQPAKPFKTGPAAKKNRITAPAKTQTGKTAAKPSAPEEEYEYVDEEAGQ